MLHGFFNFGSKLKTDGGPASLGVQRAEAIARPEELFFINLFKNNFYLS